MTRKLRAGAVLAAAFVVVGAAPAVAGTAPPDDVAGTAVVRLDGRPAGEYDATDPLALLPDRELAVALEVTNAGEEPLVVRSVRLDGRVLGVTFLDYDTRVDAVVEPGGSAVREFTLDLGRLNEQAVGLLPVEVTVLDDAREPIGAAVDLVVDAHGSLDSAYGLFGLLVAVATALLLGAALVRLVRGTLPENRWYRAVRFAVPGAGIGLTVAVSLSVLRLLVPSPGSALTIVVACGLAGLVLGFLTPAPDLADVGRTPWGEPASWQQAPPVTPGSAPWAAGTADEPGPDVPDAAARPGTAAAGARTPDAAPPADRTPVADAPSAGTARSDAPAELGRTSSAT